MRRLCDAFLLPPQFPALKGRAKIIGPLRGPLRPNLFWAPLVYNSVGVAPDCYGSGLRPFTYAMFSF
jgi:hypothetical protein